MKKFLYSYLFKLIVFLFCFFGSCFLMALLRINFPILVELSYPEKAYFTICGFAAAYTFVFFWYSFYKFFNWLFSLLFKKQSPTPEVAK